MNLYLHLNDYFYINGKNNFVWSYWSIDGSTIDVLLTYYACLNSTCARVKEEDRHSS